jgi:hypothetical protein
MKVHEANEPFFATKEGSQESCFSDNGCYNTQYNLVNIFHKDIHITETMDPPHGFNRSLLREDKRILYIKYRKDR